MNAQGLGDKRKRKDVLNLLKSKKYSICMIPKSKKKKMKGAR